MDYEFDVIVVGSGIAGLTFALKLAKLGRRVAIVTKKNSTASNTNYAQGGIACVTSDKDDFDLHVKDTLTAGDGLCMKDVVEQVIEDGPSRIQELVDVGVAFSQLEDGRISLGKEGGHSKRRILHVADLTGAAIEKALLDGIAKSENIETFEHFLGIDIITASKLDKGGLPMPLSEDCVVGMYALDVKNERVVTFKAGAILLATGGAGRVYQYTTNPDIATGDGIAMAYRAGVGVKNMEFVQFHPTALYSSDGSDRFLISEAVRGEGAILRNHKGKAFMKKYDERKELAPRDIVARAIDQEMKRSGARHMWLDITHQPKGLLLERFPTIYQKCLERGIDISKDYIPVVPAAHYTCGGIETTINAETELSGLYACGEVGCTGLHGANRLASNSLLEAVVMAHRGAQSVIGYLAAEAKDYGDLPEWKDGDTTDSDERVVLAHNYGELKHTMWDYVGIVRTTKRLQRARTRIQNLSKEINEYYWNFKVDAQLLELRNLIQVGELIVKCALQREESRGLHYTLDYPKKLPDARDSFAQRRER